MSATPSRGVVIIGGSGTRTVEQIHDHTLFWSEGSVPSRCVFSGVFLILKMTLQFSRPSLPYDLEDAAAVSIGESIYLFGGWMYVGATDHVLFLG